MKFELQEFEEYYIREQSKTLNTLSHPTQDYLCQKQNVACCNHNTRHDFHRIEFEIEDSSSKH